MKPLLLSCLLLFAPLAACAAQRSGGPATVVILCDGVSLDDLLGPNLPHVRALAHGGAVGLMSTPVAGARTGTSAMLSVALGYPAPAEATDEEAFETWQPVEGATAGLVYRRRTGWEEPVVSHQSAESRRGEGEKGRRGEGETPASRPSTIDHQPSTLSGLTTHDSRLTTHPIVHLGIAPLARRVDLSELAGTAIATSESSSSHPFTPSPRHPFTISVAGNADTDRPGRSVALLAIGARGIAALGWISRTATVAAPDRAFGVADNPRLADWAAAMDGTVVVRLGDGARAEAVRQSAAYPEAHRKALQSMDGFVVRLQTAFAVRHATPRILLASIRPPYDARGGWDRLAVAVAAGPEIAPGLLTSATTRSMGLISSADLAPTILAWANADQPASMPGHTVRAARSGNLEAALRALDAAVTADAHSVLPVFLLLGACCIVVAFGGLGLVWSGRSARAAAYGLLFLVNMPLGMLLAPMVHPGSVAAELAAILGAMLLCTVAEVLGARVLTSGDPGRRAHWEALLAMGLTGGAIVADCLAGQPLMKLALFSFGQLQGIRFYGIGNEYMGTLVGVTLSVAFLAGQKGRRGEGEKGSGRVGERATPDSGPEHLNTRTPEHPPISGLTTHDSRLTSPAWQDALFLAVLFVLGWPGLGAKAGGVIAGAVAFGTARAALRGRRATWRVALLWLLAGMVALGAITLADRQIGGASASHIGGALAASSRLGSGYLGEIAVRKLEMDLRILAEPYVVAALAGFAVLVLIGGILLREPVRRVAQEYAYWTSGLPAAGWGALAAFLFNDSGSVAAIFLFSGFFACGLYFLFALSANHQRLPPPP